MGAFLLATAALFHLMTTGVGLECYLCRGGVQPSLQECDKDLTIQTCQKTYQNPRCGIFSFHDSGTGTRKHGRSCVLLSYCKDLGYFCKSVASEFLKGTAKDCELQCCNEERCNYEGEVEDSEDCDWVYSGSSPLVAVSGLLFGVCAWVVNARVTESL